MTIETPSTAKVAAPVLTLTEERLQAARQVFGQVEARARKYSNLRLEAFLVLVAVSAFALWENTPRGMGLVAATLALLVAVIVRHELLLRRVVEARRRVQYWADGLDRLENRWAGRGTSGANFLEEHHLYAADLDLFGKGSVFELLCSARTGLGERRLADWLLHPTTPAVAADRQQAVRELIPHHGLREDLAMLGPDIRAYVHPEALIHWGAGPLIPFAPWEKTLARLFPVATVCALIAWAIWPLPLSIVALAVLAQVIFALRLRNRVLRALEPVDFAAKDLGVLSLVLRRFEAERFTSSLLATLHARLYAGGMAPSKRIHELSRLSELLDSRLNQAFAAIAPILLWSTNCAIAIEAWRGRNGAHLGEWLDAVADLETLGSLSRYASEHPEDCWPEFIDGGRSYRASGLAHPLIPPGVAIRNDVNLDERESLWIVSGSNMSGKSTLLRAVGLSVVLAHAGAPIRARALTLAPFRVGASIRVSDNLQEGESRFYAEIRRIRDVLELARSHPPVLFLLDEIFSGTNSHDRRLGAQAIFRSLVERGATGLVTTHDLALTRIEGALEGKARNVHFEDEIVDGKMRFDYRMREGVVARSNALELMRSIGIDL
ncbi:MAG: DNA mismatch repair protein MutS [Bryobacterales bacterium]|nr:DNA mismatch repair protein MutS [Bryobacterales bacterium]